MKRRFMKLMGASEWFKVRDREPEEEGGMEFERKSAKRKRGNSS